MDHFYHSPMPFAKKIIKLRIIVPAPHGIKNCMGGWVEKALIQAAQKPMGGPRAEKALQALERNGMVHWFQEPSV